MRACALVCKLWLPIARIHIFHTINLGRRAMGEVDRVAHRFCELLHGELDVTQLIREISIHWSAILAYSLLKKVDFTRLTRLGKFSLSFISWSHQPPELIRTIQILFTLPSLTHLVFHSHIFEDVKQFATLFDECRLNLKTLTLIDTAIIRVEDIQTCMDTFDSDRPRAQLRSLTLSRGSLELIVPWLLHAHSPIDLSTLKNLSYEYEDIPMLRELLSVVSSSLEFLDIMSPSSKYVPSLHVRMLTLVCRTHRHGRYRYQPCIPSLSHPYHHQEHQLPCQFTFRHNCASLPIEIHQPSRTDHACRRYGGRTSLPF